MAEFSLPDLCDNHSSVLAVLAPGYISYGQRQVYAGSIATVKCHEDNSLVAERLAQPGEGRVLVVDGGGSMRCALLGDNLALKGSENGWAGVLIYGCVRDVEILAGIDIGVHALAANPMRSVKRDTGLVDVPLHFAGVHFVPGQFLYADRNGLAVAPLDLLL
ncbi:MAG: ribonuclease E activity regulator RraA [Proteobacteria bacterium]|nr:ribonuclease E activity regulator RraA [Pseudomonadota bacterium]